MGDFLILAFSLLVAGVVAVPLATRFGLGTVLGPALAPLLLFPQTGLTGPFFAFALFAVGVLIALRLSSSRRPLRASSATLCACASSSRCSRLTASGAPGSRASSTRGLEDLSLMTGSFTLDAGSTRDAAPPFLRPRRRAPCNGSE